MGELIGTPYGKTCGRTGSRGREFALHNAIAKLNSAAIYLIYLPGKPRGAATRDGSGIVGSFAVGVSTQSSPARPNGGLGNYARTLAGLSVLHAIAPRKRGRRPSQVPSSCRRLQTAEHLTQWSHMPCRFIATLRPLPVPDKRHAQAK